HGGADEAVYAFSREDLDFWAQELGRPLPDGSFGENLTSQGIDLAQLIINQRVRIGTTVLEVSVPRSPCATFAAWLDEKGWVKTFTHRGDCGAYFRVIIPGEISPAISSFPKKLLHMAVGWPSLMPQKRDAKKSWPKSSTRTACPDTTISN